jgi:FixJ family two-component response regulator
MNGRQLALELVSTRPDMPVLFVSGYSADILMHRAELPDTIKLLTKPYTGRQLAEAVWQAINKAE